jgi:hypothetical protein
MKKELFYTAFGDWNNGVEFYWSATSWWYNFYDAVIDDTSYTNRFEILNEALKKYNAVYSRKPTELGDKFRLTFDSEEDYLEFILEWS